VPLRPENQHCCGVGLIYQGCAGVALHDLANHPLRIRASSFDSGWRGLCEHLLGAYVKVLAGLAI